MKKRSLPLVVFLYLLTGGVYGLYWLATAGFAARVTRPELKTADLSGALLGAFALLMLAVILGMASLPDAAAPSMATFQQCFAVGALAAFLVYVVAAILSARLAKHLRRPNVAEAGECSPAVAALLAVIAFTSAIYLQHHVNRNHLVLG
jgi:hypothetical protein